MGLNVWFGDGGVSGGDCGDWHEGDTAIWCHCSRANANIIWMLKSHTLYSETAAEYNIHSFVKLIHCFHTSCWLDNVYGGKKQQTRCVRAWVCVCIAYMKQNNKFNWKGRMRANEMANERANERCARIRMRQWMRSQSERERLKLNERRKRRKKKETNKSEDFDDDRTADDDNEKNCVRVRAHARTHRHRHTYARALQWYTVAYSRASYSLKHMTNMRQQIPNQRQQAGRQALYS